MMEFDDAKLTTFAIRIQQECARLNSEVLRQSAEIDKLRARMIEIADMIEKRSERTP
jgi:hypothetical protein